jgi:hypothetical protein
MNELLHLRRTLEAMLEAREESVNHGMAKNYEEYKQWIGECTGLRLSIAEINSLLKNYEDLEDDDATE